jgi:uncharacterized BrkB/YihY/UPF0761 family membrane protein
VERLRAARERAQDAVSATEDAAEDVTGAVSSRTPGPVKKLLGWFTGDEFFTTSSSLAFYALISIPPMTIIALWIAGGFVDADQLRELGEELSDGAPDELEIHEIVAGLIEVATSVGWVSVLTAFWPATAYGAALAKGFGMIASEPERDVKGWKGRILSLGVVALLPMAVFGAIALSFLGPRLLGAGGLALRALFLLAAAALYFVVVLLVFRLFRVRDETLGDLFLGAGLATLGQAGLTVGYLLYLQFGADFEETYGRSSLAIVVLLALYLLFSNALLLSCYRYILRRCHERQRRDDEDEPSPEDPYDARERRAKADRERAAGSRR